MGGKGQEHAQAEDLERMLPAHHQRPGPTGLQELGVARHELQRHHRQRQEVREAQHVQVDLVDGIDHLLDHARDILAHPRKVPTERDDERECEICNGNGEGHPGMQDAGQALRSPQCAPGAEHEQQLPSERIEIPVTARIARQVPVELPGEHVKQDGGAERQGGANLQEPQDRRKQQKQNNVKRQHVHVGRLEFEQQRLDDRYVGLLEKIENVHLFRIKRVLEADRHVRYLGEIDREEKDMGDVDLPGAAQDAGPGHHEAALPHFLPVYKRRGIAGDENEDLGRVAEAVITDGDPGHQVRGNMVKENQPQRQAAEQVEPQVASAGDYGGWRIGRLHARLRICARSGRPLHGVGITVMRPSQPAAPRRTIFHKVPAMGPRA